MKFGIPLFGLEIGQLSIEEIAELKKVTVKAITKNLRELGYSILDFRMWKDTKREMERLFSLRMNHTLAITNFDERYDQLVCEGTTEGMRPVGELFDVNDIRSHVEHYNKKSGLYEWVEEEASKTEREE